MIINRHARVGLFQKEGLFVVDLARSEKTYLHEYAGWEPVSISPDGKRFAIRTTCAHRGAYRTHVVVMAGADVLFNTKDYYVYDIAFNATGEQILIVAEKKKPFCYHLLTQDTRAELPKSVRLYKGDLDQQQDVFLVPCDKTKDTCYAYSFATGTTEVVKMGTQAMIARLRFSDDLQRIYLVTETNILYCFDRAYQLIWQKDFNYLGKAGGRIHASDIFTSEDGKLLCVYTSASETNNWGTEYVVDSMNGDIVNQIENYQFRGRVGAHFFGNQVLTHKLTTLDMLTGETGDSGI
jgi:hypothetical protein